MVDTLSVELESARGQTDALHTEKARLSERLENRQSEIERLRKQVEDLQAKFVSPKQ